MKIGPLIRSLKNKGVLSFSKALPVCPRLWGGLQACFGILATLAEFGHSEMALNLFSLRF